MHLGVSSLFETAFFQVDKTAHRTMESIREWYENSHARELLVATGMDKPAADCRKSAISAARLGWRGNAEQIRRRHG